MIPGIIDLIPSSGIPVGPLDIGFYGLGYVIAVLVLLWVTAGEARRRGIDPARVNGALVTVAICALIGALTRTRTVAPTSPMTTAAMPAHTTSHSPQRGVRSSAPAAIASVTVTGQPG